MDRTIAEARRNFMASTLDLYPLCVSSSLSEGARRYPGRRVQVCAVILEVQSDAGLKSSNRRVAAGGQSWAAFPAPGAKQLRLYVGREGKGAQPVQLGQRLVDTP